MGHVAQEIREFCRQTRGLGSADRVKVRMLTAELMRALLPVVQDGLEEDEFLARMLIQAHGAEVMAACTPRLVASLIEEACSAKLSDGERQKLTAVPTQWELISKVVCYFVDHAGLSGKTPRELAQHFLVVVCGVSQVVAYDSLMALGLQVEQVASSLAERLGLATTDDGIESARTLGKAFTSAAKQQTAVTVAANVIASGAGLLSEPTPELIALAAKFFRPGKALERRLQGVREDTWDRPHLDRVSLLMAWDAIMETWRDQETIWPHDVVSAVRHHLRETYKGESGQQDKEAFSLDQSSEPRESDGHSLEDEVVDRLSFGLSEELADRVASLPEAEREAVLDVIRAVEKGDVTLSGKFGDSLRQVWGADYERKRKALNRARKKLQRPNSG